LKTPEQTLVSLTANIMLRAHKHFAHHLESNTQTYLRFQFHMTVTMRIASFFNLLKPNDIYIYIYVVPQR